MMRHLLSLVASLTALAGFALSSVPAQAWGALGHRTVGAIAWKNVKPATRVSMARLLAHQSEMDTPRCSMKTLEDAAVWPDCVKGERWRFAYASSWHYQNIPICEPFDFKAACRDGNCVTAQIDRNAKLLANRKLAPVLRLEALAFLVHFLGDVHQPLHVGENHDLGGNRVKADYGIAPGRNLHSIWDGVLAERAITSARPPLVRAYSAEEKAELATGKVEDWARESYEVSRDFLYPAAFGGTLPCETKEVGKVVWDNAAIEKAIPIVDRRIEQAGLRLAKILDAVLAG